MLCLNPKFDWKNSVPLQDIGGQQRRLDLDNLDLDWISVDSSS